MVKNPTHICILGGGFGGLYTALSLSRYYIYQVVKPQITLVDKTDHFLFTPLLYELITKELDTWEIAPTFEKLLANTCIKFVKGIIQEVDLTKRQIVLHNGILNYDRLVLALGASTPIDGVPCAADVIPFRTLAHVKLLLARLRELESSNLPKIRVAIVGAGPNGIELACKLADRLKNRGDILLVDRGEKILKGFSIASQRAAAKALALRNVQLNLKTNINSIGIDHITLVCDTQVNKLKVDLVLWTVGTKSLGRMPYLTRHLNSDGKLFTRTTLQLIDHPEVFALGDIALVQDKKCCLVPATAQAASQQAKLVARNLKASLSGKPLHAFRYLHLGEMLTLGKGSALVTSFGITLTGKLASFIRQWVYLFRLPTFNHRLQVARHWLLKKF